MPDLVKLSEVDQDIYNCLDFEKGLKSFFVFAGAGSGKTRSLTNVLEKLKQEKITELRIQGKRVAVITYTNAACEEIKERINFDKSFEVSTIHSFCWSLIQNLTIDIRQYLKSNLEDSIAKKEKQIQKSRKPDTKKKYERQLSRLQKRLTSIEHVKKFIYSPGHYSDSFHSVLDAEVIGMATKFLISSQLMQQILINQYPILLIDESQDTNKKLLEALLNIEAQQPSFCLGLFGDMMQRIYMGGKEDLNSTLPSEWERPKKVDNHRCSIRIVRLINKIRSVVDDFQQKPKSEEQGNAFVFLVDKDVSSPQDIEQEICRSIANQTNQDDWLDPSAVKTLVLEHKMAAIRGGFERFFNPLHDDSKTRDTITSGDSSELIFLNNQIVPLIEACVANDEFLIMQILRKYDSPRLNDAKFAPQESQGNLLNELAIDVAQLCERVKQAEISVKDILRLIFEYELLRIPEKFIDAIENSASSQNLSESAWSKALGCNTNALLNYCNYINGKIAYSTHQGVKGLEFDRVMVVMSDHEAGGSFFNYEKLFAIQPLSKTDLTNRNEGKETALDRTRRLLYVTSSRAKKDLVWVVYSSEKTRLKEHLLQQDYFTESEIVDYP